MQGLEVLEGGWVGVCGGCIIIIMWYKLCCVWKEGCVRRGSHN